MRALLARVQRKAARACRWNLSGQVDHLPAMAATRHRPRARHVQGTRSEGVIAIRSLCDRSLRFVPGIAGILIPRLTVLTITQRKLHRWRGPRRIQDGNSGVLSRVYRRLVPSANERVEILRLSILDRHCPSTTFLSATRPIRNPHRTPATRPCFPQLVPPK